MTPEEIRQRWPKTKDCTCRVCAEGCQRPGWFLPDEVRVAAEFLGLSLKEFFDQYLVLDWWYRPSDSAERFAVLSPGKLDEHGGIASFGFVNSLGTCIFLKDDRCSIHPVKPQECRSAHHSRNRKSRREEGRRQHYEVAKFWSEDEEGRALVQEVGFDPDSFEVPLPDWTDLSRLGY